MPDLTRVKTDIRNMLLRDAIRQSIVVCYKEDVSALMETLSSEGLRPVEQRASYSDAEMEYSRHSRCLLNHVAAWRRASEMEGYTLICEGDFVPCKGLGTLPVFWPEDENSWGYLYQGSPRLLSLVGEEECLRGHCSPTVAYVVNQKTAKAFLDFLPYQLERFRLEDYFTWEAHLQWWAMGKGYCAYFPERHYGEHGGMPNPEHRMSGLLPRGGIHRADVLERPLEFLPQYAQGSRLRYRAVRALAYSFGWTRLLTNRWTMQTDVYQLGWADRIKMFGVGALRLLPGGRG